MTTLQLSKNGKIVLETRYLQSGETPEDLFRRVAQAIADPEESSVQAKWETTFYNMMASCEFIPNSPTLFNAGTGQGTLSACFVIPVKDSMDSIMKAATTSAMIQKFGGGIGYAFSHLRSRGSKIRTTQGKACGAVAVLKMMSSLSDMITQGGKRHGANMGILNVQHPEISEFIHMKDDNQTAQNFNISVAATDEFMKAVEEDLEIDLIDPHEKWDNGVMISSQSEVVGKLPARQIWKEIVESAWKTGDPGLYFIDEGNRHNPTPHLGNLDSTNPCGEVPLLAFEACNLGSINLAKFVDNDDFAYARLEDITRKATRFLDNVVTVNEFPTPEVAHAVESTRKIGLGIMGWHDALIDMGIGYDSPKALELANNVMSLINQVSREVSLDLATERGPYPECREDIPIRNATRTCIAPTGSISAIAGCSSGIEPIFAVAFVKNVLDGKQLKEVNPYFVKIAKEKGFYSEALMDRISKSGSVQDDPEVPDGVKSLFKTALEIDYRTHVMMQAVYQKHTDLAVSKTVNMPNSATVEDVENAYRLAFQQKCKGITLYRDGSKPTQVLEVQREKEPENTEDEKELVERLRPQQMKGVTERIRTGHGNMFITINFDENEKPFEVFSTLGKAGGCDSAQLEAISRLVSLALRSGIDAREIVEHLKGITCCPAWDNGVLVHSAPDAVALALEKNVLSEERGQVSHSAQLRMFTDLNPKEEEITHAGNGNGNGNSSTAMSRIRCPDCNGPLAMQEMCLVCISCGWNKCGG